jgi:hypothetical protein
VDIGKAVAPSRLDPGPELLWYLVDPACLSTPSSSHLE